MIKKPRLLFGTIFLIVFLTSCDGYFNECYFSLPKNFKKNITIHFGMKDYPRLKKNGAGDYHIKVDTSGNIFTSTMYSEYFDYQGEYFQWEGSNNVYSIHDLLKMGIIESAVSVSSKSKAKFIKYEKFVFIFNPSPAGPVWLKFEW